MMFGDFIWFYGTRETGVITSYTHTQEVSLDKERSLRFGLLCCTCHRLITPRFHFSQNRLDCTVYQLERKHTFCSLLLCWVVIKPMSGQVKWHSWGLKNMNQVCFYGALASAVPTWVAKAFMPQESAWSSARADKSPLSLSSWLSSYRAQIECPHIYNICKSQCSNVTPKSDFAPAKHGRGPVRGRAWPVGFGNQGSEAQAHQDGARTKA